MKYSKVIKTIVNIGLAVVVVPPVIEGGIIIAKTTSKLVENKIIKSERFKNIKEDLKCKRQGIITVNYEEVNK